MTPGSYFLVLTKFSSSGVGVLQDGAGLDVVAESAGDLRGDGGEGLDLVGADGVVERVGGGDGADEDEHDEAHALLSVVGAVAVADAAAGEDQQETDVERRRRGALGGLVEAGIAGDAA